jgi:hypothetical protein
VQCEAQASLSALRRELPPVLLAAALELWLLLQLNTLLRFPYLRAHALWTLRSGLLGGSLSQGPP